MDKDILSDYIGSIRVSMPVRELHVVDPGVQYRIGTPDTDGITG
jgi:hypothetical protein